MSTDEIYDFDGTPVISTRGGARPGAGRKPAGYQKPDEAISFDKAKARKEAALADLHELDYKVKSGQYVSRVAVRQASATAIALMAQTLRSVSDTLERKGVPVSVCATVEEVITDTLTETGRALAKLHAEPAIDVVPNRDLF
jgi:hypothetical protein